MQGPAGFPRKPVAQSFGLAPDGGEILVARRHQWAHQKGADAAAELVLLLRLLEFSQTLAVLAGWRACTHIGACVKAIVSRWSLPEKMPAGVQIRAWLSPSNGSMRICSNPSPV